MRPTKPTLAVAIIAALVAAAPAGCNAILGEGYTVVPSDAGTSTPDTAIPLEAAKGDGGQPNGQADGCVATPTTKAQFESACTNGTCVPFDNATRNTRCDAGGTACPAATPVSAPADSGADAGAVDANPGAADATDDADDAAPPDAGPADTGPPPPPSCSTLTAGPAGGALPPTFIYATGSTAIQPYVARVAQVLENLNIATVIYLGAGSCLGVSAMLQGYPLTTNGKTATYYDPTLSAGGTVQSGVCTVDLPSKVPDLGISDVFPTTCNPELVTSGLPANVRDFPGPVQVMEMVVPATSTQRSISAEAAYMVWGFGAQSGVAPWTDPTFLLQRSATSGTENMVGTAINLPPSAYVWSGIKNAGSANVVTAITNVTKGLLTDGGAPTTPLTQANIDGTIGILASDVADGNRQVLKPLAFQDVGEACGWFPDSTQTSFDKRNVRDGHYPIWGPSHFIAYVDSNGNPVNPKVKALIDALNGENTQVLASLDIVQFYATSHIIPSCAMHVSRGSDGQDYSSFAPQTSCSCYYDLAATGQVDPARCVSCKASSDCASAPNGATSCVLAFGIPPVGFCEAPGH
jgi:hypothetical protein